MFKIFNDIFGDISKEFPTKYIGDFFYIKLDESRRIEVSFCFTEGCDSAFCSTDYLEHYDSIKLRLLDKKKGELHCQIVRFADIFSCMQDFNCAHTLEKVINHNNGKYFWWGNPTKEDLDGLRETLVSYIEIWE